MREKDHGFSATTANIGFAHDFGQTSLLEYGVRGDLTLGTEINLSRASNGATSGSALLFLRRPIGPTNRPNVWAYVLGFGGGWTGEIIRPTLFSGLSWGHGLSLHNLNGWMAVDTSVTWDLYFADHLAKIDSTVGLNFTDRFSGMVQVFHARIPGFSTTSVAPSIVFRPIKDKPDIRLQIGGEMLIGAPQTRAIKLSFWREF